MWQLPGIQKFHTKSIRLKKSYLPVYAQTFTLTVSRINDQGNMIAYPVNITAHPAAKICWKCGRRSLHDHTMILLFYLRSFRIHFKMPSNKNASDWPHFSHRRERNPPLVDEMWPLSSQARVIARPLYLSMSLNIVHWHVGQSFTVLQNDACAVILLWNWK